MSVELFVNSCFLLKRSVFVGLVLLAVIPLNDAACWVKNLNQGATRCQDYVDKTWHAVGSSWTNSRCEMCKCHNDILRCCDGLPSHCPKGAVGK
ncbi:hypothetical protein NFI96_023078 [Prochilodus magdalenae]|nr:hypothetical protein NFI96_023078 [Prochilodus magdalenae]